MCNVFITKELNSNWTINKCFDVVDPENTIMGCDVALENESLLTSRGECTLEGTLEMWSGTVSGLFWETSE